MITLYAIAAYIVFDSSECRSLKEKRRVIKSLIDKAKNHFQNIAFAEVGDANQIQQFTIGFSLLANSKILVENMFSKATQYLEENSFRDVLKSHAEIIAL